MSTVTQNDVLWPVRWTVDDATGLAAVTVKTPDVGKYAKQLDTRQTWQAVCAGSGADCWAAVGGGMASNFDKSAVALTYGSTVAVDCSAGQIFTLAMTDDCTVSAPTGTVVGEFYTFIITQGAASKTITWTSANYKGLAASLANTEVDTAIDVFTFRCTSSGVLYLVKSELNINAAS